MSSFIYFYSKFTEDFLLLGAAAIFTLLSVYCYHWVVRKRLLGAARNQVPAGMVRIYLNQLINEAQSVRTQLFGLLGASQQEQANSLAKFQMPATGGIQNYAPSPTSAPSSGGGEIPSDLLDRLKALEGLLAQKESMVVNVNIEKMKLLEEVENLKQNQKAMQSSGSGDSADLLKKIKSLEERLDEYALFEDDLANLKRLQQENAQLKKRLSEGASTPAAAAAPAPVAAAPEPKVETQIPTVGEPILPVEEPKKVSTTLDSAAIDQLLDGMSATPTNEAPPAPAKAAVATDDFEKLVDSVEGSLDKTPEPVVAAPAPVAAAPAPAPVAPPPVAAAPAPVAAAPAPVAAAPTPVAAAPAPAPAQAAISKTDEELLKEFENLLNS